LQPLAPKQRDKPGASSYQQSTEEKQRGDVKRAGASARTSEHDRASAYQPNSSRSPPASHASHDCAVLAPLRHRLQTFHESRYNPDMIGVTQIGCEKIGAGTDGDGHRAGENPLWGEVLEGSGRESVLPCRNEQQDYDCRAGTSSKTMITSVGPVTIPVNRIRDTNLGRFSGSMISIQISVNHSALCKALSTCVVSGDSAPHPDYDTRSRRPTGRPRCGLGRLLADRLVITKN